MLRKMASEPIASTSSNLKELEGSGTSGGNGGNSHCATDKIYAMDEMGSLVEVNLQQTWPFKQLKIVLRLGEEESKVDQGVWVKEGRARSGLVYYDTVQPMERPEGYGENGEDELVLPLETKNLQEEDEGVEEDKENSFPESDEEMEEECGKTVGKDSEGFSETDGNESDSNLSEVKTKASVYSRARRSSSNMKINPSSPTLYQISTKSKRKPRRHSEGHHRCPKCQLSFAAQNSLYKHIRGKHPKLGPFKCSKCSLRFQFLRDLRQHVCSKMNLKK